MRRLLAVGLTLSLMAACSSDGEPRRAEDTTTSTAAPDAETTTTAPLATGTLDAIELATVEIGRLEAPTALAVRPGSADLYIAEKQGWVRLIKATADTTTKKVTYQVQNTPLLDISDDVIDEGERGLLGMTFSSDGRKLYVDYTRQPDGHTVLKEYELGDRSSIDARSGRQLLLVEQPFANHNGGQLLIGPDGFLYVGLGDGGNGGDPMGNGQDPSTLLGSILRIDPVAAGEGGPEYSIPPGNPFADGADGAPETWLYGVRNPWRFTFDSSNGDLWVADVGQDAFEEIDHLPAAGGFDAGRGANLGWNEMEATHPFDGGENPPGAVLPIFEYGRDQGCSITGGYVYRGDAIPALAGTYLYADFCSAGIRGLQRDGETVIDSRTWDLPIEQIQSFGQGDEGELYLLLASGPVLELTAG